MVVIIWIYDYSLLFFLGAEFTYALANREREKSKRLRRQTSG